MKKFDHSEAGTSKKSVQGKSRAPINIIPLNIMINTKVYEDGSAEGKVGVCTATRLTPQPVPPLGDNKVSNNLPTKNAPDLGAFYM